MNIDLNFFFKILPLVFAVASATPPSPDTPRELPGKDDDFEDIRVKNKVYVDKSDYIAKLLLRGTKLMRMCRPPHFGKNNFLQMLGSFFAGKKELFEGLAVYTNPQNDWQTYPVLYLNFGAMNVGTLQDFQADLSRAITKSGKTYGIAISETDSVKSQLWQFLYESSEKQGRSHSIVVLINEYDWPVRRHVEINHDKNVAREMKRFLDDFFVLFRVRNDDIKLLFLTCTTKLLLTDLDKGVRSSVIDDITHDPEFGAMIGLSEQELTYNFKPHIDAMVATAGQPNETFHTLVRTLKARYDGYCFSQNTSSACRLHSFRSIISCLREKKTDNYWLPRDDPEYNAIEVYRTHQHRLKLKCPFTAKMFSNVVVLRSDLERTYNFDEEIPPHVCMILRGYLTFRSYDRLMKWFRVDFANEEMRETFEKEMLECLPGGDLTPRDISEKCDKIRQSMSDGNCQEFIAQLNSIAFSPEEVMNLTDARRPQEYDAKLIDRVVRVLEACDMNAIYNYEFHHQGGAVVAGVVQLMVELSDEAAYAFDFERKKTAAQAFTRLLDCVKRRAFQENFSDRLVYLMGVRFGAKGGTMDEWIRVTYMNGNCSDLRASSPSYKKMFAKVTKTSCINL